MGKKKRDYVVHHKQSLGDQLENPETWGVRTQPRPSKRRRDGEEDEQQEEELVPAAMTARILKQARSQQEEIDAEDAPAGAAALQLAGRRGVVAAAAKGLQGDSESEEEWSDDGYEFDEEIEVSAEDEAALAAFMAPGADDYQQKTLADLVLERIRQKQAEQGVSELPREGDDFIPGELDPKVVEVYQGVGKVLSRYTAGKVPKAFKVIPNLQNWEEILYMTDPENWSPHAVYQATRMFVSNLNQKMSQRFLVLVLLPHVRADIRKNRRLHFALFQSLKKATYKAAAFYKGLLLPLCASGTCNLREAVIFTSVIRRTSIPVLHSAAAMLRIAEMPYSGTNSFFLRVLLDKKYALPYRVVDALVDHFLRFKTEERLLPVVWQQTLLCFVQRYKTEVRAEDKTALRDLVKRQHHYALTPEILRELDSSRSRGEAAPAPDAGAPVSKVAAAGGSGEDPRDLAPIIMMDD
ncbi:Bystin [Micractinium conductrix]|uniref:Bystin n=1 Tax=Micractinium conductrix TaxID=554055 RepID=A0A2P6VAV6_9CHLO|nr:Bystin [Micractinium conductrix]|eukprot:PSC71236.1 Bystin [Micractinium conductrix]